MRKELGRQPLHEQSRATGLDYVYGRQAVREWLRAGWPVKCLYLAADISGDIQRELESAAASLQIVVKRSPRSELNQLVASSHHQGVVAEVQLPAYASVDVILRRAEERGEPALLAVLDCVQDPHNLGAILRNADGAGVHGIIIPKDNAAPLTPAVVKASAGAAAYVPLARVTNLVRTMEELKQAGLWLVGTDHNAWQRFDQIDLKGPVGIVLGAEGKGLRRLVRERCDFLVHIPMKGKVNSLNVSAAAALLFYEARRQRQW